MQIPKGEKGSLYDLAQRAIDEPDWLILEYSDKPQVLLNVIGVLEEYRDYKTAFGFAKKVINEIGLLSAIK